MTRIRTASADAPMSSADRTMVACATALCLSERSVCDRGILGQLADVLPEVNRHPEGPLFVIGVQADALVAASRGTVDHQARGGAFTYLRFALEEYFASRAAVAFDVWRGR